MTNSNKMHNTSQSESSSNIRLDMFRKLLEKEKAKLSDMIRVKSGLGLVTILLKIDRLISSKAPTKSTVKVIKHFCRDVYLLHRGSGMPHVIKYLKTCSVLLQQSVAKHHVKSDSRAIGQVAVSTTGGGLPRIIPRLQRELIRKGDLRTITLWLSLFNLYRFLNSKHKNPDYKTVTESGSWIIADDYHAAISRFWVSLRNLIGDVNFSPSEKRNFSLSEKVSSVISMTDGLTGTSLVSLMRAIWTWRLMLAESMGSITLENMFSFTSRPYWKRFSSVLPALVGVAKVTAPWVTTLLEGKFPLYDTLGHEIALKTPQSEEVPPSIPRIFTTPPNFGLGVPYRLGRLVCLKEPAGKNRIIAIVDPLTQIVLKPIHDWIFSILRRIPQDGTFDQYRPLVPLSTNKGFVGSCDMSSATDRLPVKLQRDLIGHILGPELSTYWRQLLVDRPYSVGLKKKFYAVGQPMGALSSWASLAITHHFLWQWAAYRANLVVPGKWYTDYAVLGDDSSSLHQRVVKKYLKICSELGVKVNLAKSLLSPNGSIEFAKKFITPFGDASPVSIGEVCVAMVNFSTMASLPLKKQLRIEDLIAIMGYKFRTLGSVKNTKWKSLPKKVRHMLIVCRSPWGSFPTGSLMEWLSLTGYNRGSNPTMYINIAILHEILRLKDKLQTLIDEARDIRKSSEVVVPRGMIQHKPKVNFAPLAPGFKKELDERRAAGNPLSTDEYLLMVKKMLSAYGWQHSNASGDRTAQWASPVTNPRTDSQSAMDTATWVFRQDPRSASLVYHMIHAEALSENRTKWVSLRDELSRLEKAVSWDAFSTHNDTIELYWKRFIDIEVRVNNVRRYTFNNSPYNPFTRSSSSSIVRRFNRLISQSTVRSKI